MTRRPRLGAGRRNGLRAAGSVAVSAAAVAVAAACGAPSFKPVATPSSAPRTSPPTISKPVAFHDPATGISLAVPIGYVVAATPAEAAARFPAVLGDSPDSSQKIADAQHRLQHGAIMIAYHTPIGPLYDNIGLLRQQNVAPAEPADIQSPTSKAQLKASLAKAQATDIVFSETKLGGQPAEQATYSIPAPGADVFGEQFYVAHGKDVFVLTITAGTQSRASDAADVIAGTWTFS